MLPPEPMLWPGELFDRDERFGNKESQWWALHTRPRTEKSLARRLLRHDVPYFLPQYERRRRLQRRLVRTQAPLFPGYLFLCAGEDGRRTALETNLVVGCLNVVDQLCLFSDLRRVHELIQSGKPFSPEAQICPGMLARITCGPLAGLEGTIIRCKGSMRFVVAVDFLQQGAAVDVDDSMIQLLDSKDGLSASLNTAS